MWPNPQFPADLITFTKEILNGKLHFCAVLITVFLGYFFLSFPFSFYVGVNMQLLWGGGGVLKNSK